MGQKQTAVEWLITELNQELNYIPITQWDRIRDLVQRAKEMEKQQIINANEDASTNELGEFLTGEQYYKQEYGK